jgi:hypothetical protein
LTTEALETRYALDATVVFNEIMYNPAGDDAGHEWIELHNQMSVNMDVSGWRIDGAVEYDFPEGTVIPGRGYVVIAADPAALSTAAGITNVLGPFTGSLSNGGEELQLYNNFNSIRTRPVPPPPPAADHIWSVDIQGVGGVISNPNPPTMTGVEPNAGFGGTWNAFNVAGHSGTTTNPSMTLVDSAGTPSDITFSIGGTVSGWANVSSDALTNDYLFVGAGNSQTSITWEITGLDPTSTYNIFPYGGVARDMAWNVDRAGDGTLNNDSAVIVPGSGVRVSGIQPSASGTIIGTMANGTGDAEGDWAGFQLVKIDPQPAAATAIAHLPGGGGLDGRRLMDVVNYDDGDSWPIEPDGSGASLAKRDPNAGSAQASSWSFSPLVGGSPGRVNFAGTGPSFTETLVDASGKSNHGAPSFISVEPQGFEGRAGAFNGASSFATLPIDINPAVHPQITLGAWVRSDVSTPSHVVLSHDNGGFDRTMGIGSGVIYESPGGEGTWNAFNVQGHSLVSNNPSMTLLNSLGATTGASFQILGSISGFSNPSNPNIALVNDYLFVNAGNSPNNVDWRLSGLVPGRTYELYAYGGVARDVGLRVDQNGDGTLTNESQLTVTSIGRQFPPIVASATGSILGNVGPGTVGEGNWSGFQLVDTVDGTLWSVDIQAINGPVGGQGIPVLQNGPLPAVPGAGYSAFAGGKQLNGSGEKVVTDTWSFITAVYDQNAATLNFYLDQDAATINDALLSYQDTAATLGAGATLTDLGRLPSGQWYFDGAIDNVFLVDRALSASEVLQLRNGGSTAVTSLGSDLLGFYRFEDLPQGGFPVELPALAINEVSSSDDAVFQVELINTGAEPVNVRDMVMTTNEASSTEFVLPSQVLQPGGYLVLDETQLGFRPADGDALFLFTQQKTSVVDAVHVDNSPRARFPDGVGPILEPKQTSFGASNNLQLDDRIVINEIMYHAYPDRGTPAIPAQYDVITVLDWNATWRYNQQGQGVAVGQLPATWATVSHAVDGTNWLAGPGVFANATEPLPGGLTRGTTLTVGTQKRTFYFETEFTVPTDAPAGFELQINHVLDDGAVFYLNGVEILDRPNMPAGDINSGTPAVTQIEPTVTDGIVVSQAQLAAAGFQLGIPQRLSVEVHQGGGTAGGITTSTDIVFGARVSTRVETTPTIPGTPYQENPEEWIELYNRSSDAIDVSGMSITGGIDFSFPPGTTIPPRGYLVVTNDAAALTAKYPAIASQIVGNFNGSLANGGERIRLEDGLGNPLDEVHYYDTGRWPELPDGGGSSLELRDADSDNALAESWRASDETGDTGWNTYTYRGIAVDDGIGNNVFREFVMGMLDAGQLLIDDVRVIENPGTASAAELLQNGSFDADVLGAAPSKWRIVGNHQGTVITDPLDPSNRVLAITATGATEDKHNHAETTFGSGKSVVPGREYEISFRAKWLGGSNQLNTRLYFNYLQRTTLVEVSTAAGTPGAPNSAAIANAGPTYRNFKHAPVVPKDSEAVQVTVDAADPDQVAAMTLYYSVNGGVFQQTPMIHAGSGQFTGTIPPQASASIVQFYVSGRDQLGAESTFPAEGANSRALYVVDDGQGALGSLHNVRIIMTPADRDFLYLNTNRMSNDYLGATIVYNESEVYYDVGARLKGSAFGRFNGTEMGFKMEFHPDQLFRGVHPSINIERAGNKKELLAMHMLGRAGGGLPSFYDDVVRIIAPRSSETGVGILAMARYSDVFLEESFENGGDGALYNMELLYNPNGTVDGNPESLKLNNPYNHTNGTVVIANRGDDKETYRWNYQMRNARGRDNYEPLIQLSKAFSLSGEALDAATQEIMDVDQWMRTWAMLSLNGNDDIYTRIFDHNFRMYVRPEDGKIIALPWDLDRAFQIATNAPLWGDENLQKVIELPVNKRLFYGHALDIVNTTANTEYMGDWATHLSSLTGQSFAAELSYIGARGGFVLSQLPNEFPFEMTTGDTLNVGSASTATIEGRAWINVREIRVANSDDPTATQWFVATPAGTSPGGVWADGWRITIPVDATTQMVTIQAYDHQGNLVGSDTITINSTAVRPIVDLLRITELMYNPPGNDDLTEYIEVMNIGDMPTGSLAGARLVDGVDFLFGEVSLAAGERAVIVRDPAAFVAEYGSVPRIVGTFTGALNNAGEQLQLVDRDGALVQQFTYDDSGEGWYPITDGDGYSLVIIDAADAVDSWNDPAAWRASNQYGGSPGIADPARGDFDRNGSVDAQDIDDLFAELRAANSNLRYDLTRDGSVDRSDIDELVLNILDTYYGDANLDGSVDGNDANVVQRSLFKEGGWAAGDFTGDRSIDGSDFNRWYQNRFRTRSNAEPAPAERTAPRAAAAATLPLRHRLLNRLRRSP